MTITAREIMAPNPDRVGEFDSLQQAAAMMWNLHVSSLPVCDEHGDLRGLIDYRDIELRCLTEWGDPASATAGSLMQEPWATVGVDDPVDDALYRAAGQRAATLPVLDGQHLAGVIRHPGVTASVTAPPQTRPAVPSDDPRPVPRGYSSTAGSTVSAADPFDRAAGQGPTTGNLGAAAGIRAPVTTRRHQVVVAGVDGSPPSIAAARWAAQEADDRHQSLQLVHAYQVSLIGFPGHDYRADLDALVRDDGEVLLARTADELRRRVPGLLVTTTLERADPRRTLVEASGQASLTVVGYSGEGRRHLGSVASHVTAHAVSPVALIPRDPGHPADGPILLGVDGSAGCQAAIGYAFDEADIRRADLFALHVWDVLAAQGFGRGPVLGTSEGQEGHAVLAEQLAGWQDKYPDVAVRRYVVRGRPGQALLRYAQNAPLHPQMIVVGGHGRRGLAGFLLGSTGRTLIGHAPCPVVVVRSDHPG